MPASSAQALFDGFSGPEDAIASNAGDLPPLRLRPLLRRGRALVRRPHLIPTMAGLGVGTAAVLAHYRRFPQRWQPDRFAQWSGRSRRLLAYRR